MDKNDVSIWKHSMNYGLIVGFAFIIIAVILYLFDLTNPTISQFVNFLIILVGIVIGTKSYRDNTLGGVISYSKALGAGTLIIFFSSIILAFYTYLFFTVIDPDAVEKIFELSEEKMIEKGMPDEQIEIAIEMTRKFTTPLLISVMIIFSITFWGFVFSLITSIFLKKAGDPFESDMKEIVD